MLDMPAHRIRAGRLVAIICLQPAIAHAHGGPCSSDSSLAVWGYFASTFISLLVVLVGPFLVAMFCPGRRGWRIAVGALAALVGWAAVAAIAFYNFLAGMGCAKALPLAALNATPALCFGALLWWLWALHRRRGSRSGG